MFSGVQSRTNLLNAFGIGAVVSIFLIWPYPRVYREFVFEQLGRVTAVAGKSMFGGVGLYAQRDPPVGKMSFHKSIPDSQVATKSGDANGDRTFQGWEHRPSGGRWIVYIGWRLVLGGGLVFYNKTQAVERGKPTQLWYGRRDQRRSGAYFVNHGERSVLNITTHDPAPEPLFQPGRQGMSLGTRKNDQVSVDRFN